MVSVHVVVVTVLLIPASKYTNKLFLIGVGNGVAVGNGVGVGPGVGV